MGLFTRKETNAVTTDNTSTDGDHHNWQTELLTELKTIVENIETKSPDYKAVAAELRRIHLDYYADKLEGLGYHGDAKHRNKSKVGAKRV